MHGFGVRVEPGFSNMLHPVFCNKLSSAGHFKQNIATLLSKCHFFATEIPAIQPVNSHNYACRLRNFKTAQ